MEQLRDEFLWKKAKKRVAFKKHLITYVVCNLFFWVVWLLTDYQKNGLHGIPWPIFSMTGWGIGLIFNFFSAYAFTYRSDDVEKEYEKLKKKNN